MKFENDVISEAEGTGFEHTDSDFYKKSDIDTYWDVIFKQLRHCCAEGSKEMTVGGVATRFIGGQVIELNLPNQREIFCNSIFILKVLLTKFLNNKGNEDYKKQLDELKEIYEDKREKMILIEDNPNIKELRRIVLKTDNESKRMSATNMYNDLLKSNKKQLEELETEYSKKVLAVSVQLMDQENFGKAESVMAME